jgi:peptide/nickel transport system permease protein
MRQYIIRRLLVLIPVLLLISLISFSLLFLLPGDAAVAMMGEEAGGSREELAEVRRQLGLDRPIYIQYADWLWSTVRGDLGTSVRFNEPVLGLLLSRAPITLYYGAAAMIIGLVISIPVALVSALKPGSKFDTVGTLLAMAGVAIPNFWLAILLMYVFSVFLGWLPPSGYVSPLEDPGQSLKLLIMPSIALGTAWSAVFMRQLRSSLIEVMEQDYIKAARAKGLGPFAVVGRHALKNSMIPLITVIGVQTGNIMSGAIIVETVFAVPGVGRLAVDSIFVRDFPTLQGAVVLMTVAVILANLVADVTYAFLDPRIRYE